MFRTRISHLSLLSLGILTGVFFWPMCQTLAREGELSPARPGAEATGAALARTLLPSPGFHLPFVSMLVEDASPNGAALSDPTPTDVGEVVLREFRLLEQQHDKLMQTHPGHKISAFASAVVGREDLDPAFWTGWTETTRVETPPLNRPAPVAQTFDGTDSLMDPPPPKTSFDLEGVVAGVLIPFPYGGKAGIPVSNSSGGLAESHSSADSKGLQEENLDPCRVDAKRLQRVSRSLTIAGGYFSSSHHSGTEAENRNLSVSFQQIPDTDCDDNRKWGFGGVASVGQGDLDVWNSLHHYTAKTRLYGFRLFAPYEWRSTSFPGNLSAQFHFTPSLEFMTSKVSRISDPEFQTDLEMSLLAPRLSASIDVNEVLRTPIWAIRLQLAYSYEVLSAGDPFEARLAGGNVVTSWTFSGQERDETIARLEAGIGLGGLGRHCIRFAYQRSLFDDLVEYEQVSVQYLFRNFTSRNTRSCL